MKKYFIYFLIGILSLVILFLNYIIQIKIDSLKECNNEIEVLQKENINQSFLLENISVISRLQHYAEGDTLDNYILYTLDGDSCWIKDLCIKKKIVYYFSEQSCQICYLPFLKKINDLSKKIGRENILVIGKFSKKRSFQLFLQDLDFKIDIDIFRTVKDFNIYPEYNDYAQAFLLKKDLVIDNICITDKSNKEQSDNYLKIIEKNFLNKDDK